MNPTDLPVQSTTPTGKLELRWLIRWLREDHLITSEDAERIKGRYGTPARIEFAEVAALVDNAAARTP